MLVCCEQISTHQVFRESNELDGRKKKEQWMQGAIVGVQDSGHTAGNNMKIGSPL